MTEESKHREEQQILEKVAKGDLKAYKVLFDTYFADLCNFLLIYLRDKSFAEEVALEIFIAVWEKRAQLQVRTNIKSYLFVAAKNRAISILRRSRQYLLSNLEIEDHVSIADNRSEDYLENKELRQILDEAIQSLPEQSRKIYQMAWEENLSHKEIAEQLGLTPKTVENHVGIALRKLRTQLRPYYKQIFMSFFSAL